MKVIGFNFTKNDFRYCVLDGHSTPPTVVDKNKISLPNNMDSPELMEWFETQLSLIIDKHKPKKISYKISINITTIDQIKNSCYPQAILNLIAHKDNLPIVSYSAQAINASKFGLPAKTTDVFAYVDVTIGKHPPYWDKPMKEAVLVSWFNLI